MTTSGSVESWRWDEATWREHVERVRAGRSLAPETWPNQARVAVALSFDCDHETIPLRDAETRPGKLSQGEYGARRLAAHSRFARSEPHQSQLLYAGSLRAPASGG